ncbi:MAG: polysaccharide biosynthesis tyrosine autokinase [Chitinophagaceae bacterium]|nr:polysaccharide biosynthesis tyrosine autokinase [Chitinophagaceae bacterium]
MQKGGLTFDGYHKENESPMQQVLEKYLPWWPLFVALVVFFIIAGLLYLRYATPIYEATGSILLKDEKKGLDESSIMESLNLFGSKKIVENEIEVLQSRAIAGNVVRNLRLYAPVMKTGTVKDISGYRSSPLLVEAQYPQLVKATEDPVYFKYDPADSCVEMGGNRYSIKEWINTSYGSNIRFVHNPYYEPSDKEKRFYFTLIPVKLAVTSFLNKLEVNASNKQSTVIELAYRDDQPGRAEDVVNEIIAVYHKAAIDDKNQLAANTLAFVDERLRYVVGDLDSVEQSLEKFKTRNSIIDISEQGRQFLQNMSVNDQKAGEMGVQLAVLDQVENYILSKDNKSAIVPSTLGISDPVLGKLLDQLYALEMQYENMKKTTAENNPLLISVITQINNIRPSILENVRNQRRNLEAGRSNIMGSGNLYASMLRDLPNKERKLLDISRQQSIKNSIYTFLLQKREETMLSYASTVADSRVVDVAEAADIPVSPKKVIVMAVALLLAMGLGIGFVELKEAMNRNIMFRSEIEKYTSIPVLGEVAYDQSGSQLVIAEGKRTFIAEQFRQLRTSLSYLGINSKKKKLMVTSSVSGEGKSFICSNLGISLALVGKKVVLIELDLRKPKLSQAFNISRLVGVSNYLIGEKEAEEIIKSTENPNLFVIPSGPLPPNPSELILSNRMQELLSYLENHFDYIIIDTAPVSPVTDAYIVSPMCDSTLYVVRHGYTPRVYIQKLDDRNKVSSLHNPAIIFNGVKNRGYGSYGYGYGYGYGYTEEETGQKKKIRLKLKA